MTLIVKIIDAKALGGELEDRWQDLRGENPALYSPYFHPAYSRAVGNLREDAFIALIYEGDHLAGFLPFQAVRGRRGRFARPIGAPLTDYHGLIARCDSAWDISEILKKANIGAFHYNSWVSRPHNEEPITQEPATVLSLPRGAEAWREARDASYRRHLKSLRRRIRKTEETYGPRRFDFQIRDSQIFETLLRWKQQQFAQTGKYDVLSVGWTQSLLQQIWQGLEGLRCDMHVLYFGDEIAAIDLGLTDGPVFHSWIVAYNHEFQNLAPGIQLLEGMIDAANSLGYERIDLGVGIDGYKRHYATDPVHVSSGYFSVSGAAAFVSDIYGITEKFGKSKLKDIPGKLRRRYSQIAACDESWSGRARAMMDAVRHSS